MCACARVCAWLRLDDEVSDSVVSVFKDQLYNLHNRPLKMERTESSETPSSANLSHTPWLNLKSKKYHSDDDSGSLKTRFAVLVYLLVEGVFFLPGDPLRYKDVGVRSFCS